MDPQFLPNGERTAAAPGSALMGREERLIANALSGGRRDVTCSWRAPKMQSVSCTAVSAVNLGVRGGLGLRAAARAVAV
jgi:hypothetical protein